MTSPARFPYVGVPHPLGQGFLMPFAPVTLRLGGASEQVSALIDSGAAVSVIPFDVGSRLGADWNALTVDLTLPGALAGAPAKGLAVEVEVAPFPAVPILVAWTTRQNAPVILGQFGFFEAFDVRFCRSRGYFEIEPRP
jgi:hypothetical protein